MFTLSQVLYYGGSFLFGSFLVMFGIMLIKSRNPEFSVGVTTMEKMGFIWEFYSKALAINFFLCLLFSMMDVNYGAITFVVPSIICIFLAMIIQSIYGFWINVKPNFVLNKG